MRFRLSILLVILALTGCWKEPSKYNWSNAPGAEQHERLMWQAIRNQEWNEVEHHLTPSFVGISATGQQFDRAGWVEHLKAMQVRDFSVGEMTVQPNGPDMVIAYEAHVSGEQSAQPSANNGVRVVSVWQQLKRGWVLILQAITPLKSS
jgi:ketosteroid isomerase-like protein